MLRDALWLELRRFLCFYEDHYKKIPLGIDGFLDRRFGSFGRFGRFGELGGLQDCGDLGDLEDLGIGHSPYGYESIINFQNLG